ncbi:MAG: adenylate/guanylate cyclase domain-containing protein, partial [Terriglobia bacterium]
MAETQQRKLAAIMFTDMVGYAALSQKDEALALELLDAHRRLLRPIFPTHGGKEIKTMGDAFLVEFASAVEAARCAIEMQKALVARNATVSADRRIQIRIGLHVGDMVMQENDVFGDGVNIASRIEPLAEPGGICLSEQVFDQIRNKIEEPTVRLGKGELKSIQVPVEIYRIVLPWERGRVPFSDRLRFSLRQKRIRSFAVALIAIVLLAGVGWWLFRGGTPIVAPGQITSLAVLPLENFMGDPEQEYFVDGMTEALITELSKIGALKVISRTSAMHYKDSDKPLPEIARELGVDAVVEGSVLRAGEEVRITAQLIHGTTDTHLWAKSYERDLRNILALQSEVAQAIADEIKLKLTPQEQARLARAQPVNPAAYEAYLRGRYYWNKRTEEGFRKGLEYFQQAAEIDPEYALAYAGLADSYNTLGSYAALPPNVAYGQGKVAAIQALELDDTLAEGHNALAWWKMDYEWDWSSAEREFRRAIELNPSYATAHHQYSHLLTAMNRTEEMLAESQRALELDPLDLIINVHLGARYYYARQYDQAIEQLQKVVEMDPNFPQAHRSL